jgi:hypothetical protein
MMFLLRAAFWLTVVLALLPSGGMKTQSAGSQIGAIEAMSAATAAVSDMRGFCTRQPDACTVGAHAAIAFGERAQAGAKMVYEMVTEHNASNTTGSVDQPSLKAQSEALNSQDTLKQGDIDANWRSPVKLPRARPAQLASSH